MSTIPLYLRSSPGARQAICQFAAERGMRLNPKKCREMVINFLQFQPTQLGPLQLMGSVVKRVNSYKILGIHVANDLSWNKHIDYVFKKADKRLYALRLLARSKVPAVDLIAIYFALVRSILEYGSPVWAPLPEYLSDVVEGVQRKALRIVFPSRVWSPLQTLVVKLASIFYTMLARKSHYARCLHLLHRRQIIMVTRSGQEKRI